MKILAVVVLVLLAFVQPAASSRSDAGGCRPVTATFCQGLGYSTTMHPTGATGFNLQQIGQMVETACSPHIATVMCRVAVPECGSDTNSRLKPCRALCEKVKTDCEAPLRAKRLYWPIRLRCDTLPQSNCIQVSGQQEHNLAVLMFVSVLVVNERWWEVLPVRLRNSNYICPCVCLQLGGG